jgi:hypothetical protein
MRKQNRKSGNSVFGALLKGIGFGTLVVFGFQYWPLVADIFAAVKGCF